MCLADKGTRSMEYCYTDVSSQARWRQTYGVRAPYAYAPSYLQLPGFEFSMVRPDVLHVFHLGVGRDLIGSAMRVLLQKSAGLFPGRTQALRLRAASERLLGFAAAHGYSLGIRRLTTANLGFQKKGYPELRGKGYDTFVILRWLISECKDVKLPGSFDRLLTCMWAADSALSVATNAARFFSDEESQHIRTVGQLFLTCYMKLAADAIQQKRRLYRVRPKLHLLCHMFSDATPGSMNFTYNATWLDEDFNKVIVVIKKKTHLRTCTAATLKRWLLGLPGYFNRASTRR